MKQNPNIRFWSIGLSALQFPPMAKPSYEVERRIFRALLIQIRQEAGMRQVDMARKLHRRQTFVSRYETGKYRLDLPETELVCEAVGIPLLKLAHRYQAALREKQQPDDLGNRRRIDKRVRRKPRSSSTKT
jgi:transcriptional regulator with XRE-family HTH domain